MLGPFTEQQVAAVKALFLSAILAVAGFAMEAAAGDTSEHFFTNGVVHLRLEIAATNLQALRRDARAYVPATVREEDVVYERVAVHLKGAAGSFRGMDDETPAFTLNFDKLKPGQSFHGLDKIHLNNSVQDDSRLTEAVCSALFLEAGVPTPRATHARVFLNNRDLGIYVLKEGFDRTFLRRHFKNVDGNLYDGGFLQDITEGVQKDSGPKDVNDRSDLKALAAAAREPDLSKRYERLDQVLDIDRFLSFVALEIMTWHWDGYALKKNNYRVFHNLETGKMVFLPHGMDQMFWDASQPILPRNMEGLVARALLQTGEGRRRYRARVASVITNVFTAAKLTNHLNQIEARLRPAFAAWNKDRAREWGNAASHVRRQILAREAFLQRVAREPEPQPLRFDSTGFARLTNWKAEDSKETGKLDQIAGPDGTRSLHITAGTNCVASWRTRVLLEKGRYVLEGRVWTAGVVPLPNETAKKGVGAGLRTSRSGEARTNSLVGDSNWQQLEYEFIVSGETEEPWLICELRASGGEAWFDLDSLRLRKL